MSSSQSQERHLLFGLLAFQNEFISHADLLKAFSEWVADKTKTLDDILVAQGAMSSEDRQLFDRLVDKHLAKFDGDATMSLSNLSGLSSIREELERVAGDDAMTLQSLAHLPTPHVSASAFQTILTDSHDEPVAPKFSTTASSRFRIVRQHARGGLGVVFLAEDQDLHREVAMKQIRDDRADIQGYRLKFMQEAEVTGQLEHPGIVPVYALGTDPKGRPYYAMRFVRGEDLQSRIRTFHANRKSQKTVFDGPELRGLLRRFVDVCNAIQYAHDRGVLHRDLKPGNVMLGKHGETLVVDWGLAKPIGESSLADPTATIEPHSESPVSRSGSASGSETQAGTFIGTPAYAPPEQVLGQLDKLGPQSDVYSLGAILYELLTGKVPVSGTTVAEVITKATTGNFPAPRSLDAGIPKPLESICRKAMALRVEGRYQSADDLCADVENWLDDSPVSAYREPWMARAHRLVRKNPVAASWIAAVVIMGLLASAGLATVSSRYNRQLVLKNEQIENEKTAAEKARDAEAIAKDAAVVSRTQAVGVRDFLVDIFRQPDPSRDGRKVTVYDSMVDGVRRVRRDFGNDPETSIALLTAIYQSYEGLGLYSDANQLINEVLDIRKKNGLDSSDAAIRNRNDLGKNLKLLGKYTQAIDTHEKLYQLCITEHGELDLLTLQIEHDLANAYRAAGRLQDALKANEEVFKDRASILPDDDPDVLSSQNTLANSLQAIGRVQEALELRQANYEKRKNVLGSKHPDTLSSMSNLAVSMLEAGDLSHALEMQTAAFEARKEVLGLEHPDTLASLFNLANVLLELGRNDDAEQMYTEAIAGLQNSLSASHPSTLAAMAGLGRILERQGQFERALAILEKVYNSQLTGLGEDHPNTLASLNSLASVYERTGKADTAQRLLEDGVSRATQVLGDAHEITVDLQLTLEVIYFSNNEIDQGLALCQKLVPITSQAFGLAHPKSLKARNNLALAYFVIGDLQQALSIYDELEITENQALGPNHPETIRTELGSLHTLRDLGRFEIALARAEATLTKSRRGLGNDNTLTLDVMGTLGYFYLMTNRATDAKPLFYEELQTRVKKFGIKDPATVLAGSYLVLASEQLQDWELVQTVANKFVDELDPTSSQAAIRDDFAFRLGYAMSMLKPNTPAAQEAATAEAMMTASLTAIESQASAPAPPQLSTAEMEARLHQYFMAQGQEDKAKLYSSETTKPPPAIQ